MTDPRLVSMAQAGDEDAIRQLLERYVPLVTGFCLGKLPETDTEDVVQEVFMTAFADIGRLRDPRKLGPWLLGIARNQCSEFHRRNGRESRVLAAMDAQATPRQVRTPAEHAEADQVEAITLATLAEMGDKYRVVLYLRLFEDLSYVDIASRLGLRDGTVRVRARRGLSELRKKLLLRGIAPGNWEGAPS